MQVVLAALADAANRSEEGKLNLLGVFQTLRTKQVPSRNPQMSIVLMLRASAGEKGSTQHLKISLIDADGISVGPEIELDMPLPRDMPGLNPELHLIVNLADLIFPRFGKYHFDIMLNNTTITILPLSVEEVPT